MKIYKPQFSIFAGPQLLGSRIAHRLNNMWDMMTIIKLLDPTLLYSICVEDMPIDKADDKMLFTNYMNEDILSMGQSRDIIMERIKQRFPEYYDYMTDMSEAPGPVPPIEIALLPSPVVQAEFVNGQSLYYIEAKEVIVKGRWTTMIEVYDFDAKVNKLTTHWEGSFTVYPMKKTIKLNAIPTTYTAMNIPQLL